MNGLHFTLQYRESVRWRTAKTYPLDVDLSFLTRLCGQLRRQKWERHWRILLMPINFLIVSTDERR